MTSIPPELAYRIQKATEQGINAFWDVIGKSFPEVKSGDLDPLLAMQFVSLAKDVVEEWVDSNVKDG